MMQPDPRLSEDLTRKLESFAENHEIRTDNAYEVLIAVGLEVLDDLAVEVYVENEQLVLECEQCNTIFDSSADAFDHDH